MSIAWLLLQLAVSAPLLDKPPATPACPSTTTSDVVVCGQTGTQERFRLRPLGERYALDPAALPKAESAILGGRAAVAAETEAGSVGGVQSNRLMMRLKVPLGKSRD